MKKKILFSTIIGSILAAALIGGSFSIVNNNQNNVIVDNNLNKVKSIDENINREREINTKENVESRSSTDPLPPTLPPESTIAKTTIRASAIGLADKTAVEVDTQNLLTPDLVYKNLDQFFVGSLNVSNSSQIKTEIRRISTKSVLLRITLAPNTWYDAKGNLGTVEKNFDIKITGFAPMITAIISPINAKELGLSQYSYWDLKNNNIVNSSFVFKNLKKFFTGKLEITSPDQIRVSPPLMTFPQSVHSSIPLSIVLAAGTTFDEHGNKIDHEVSFSTTINNLAIYKFILNNTTFQLSSLDALLLSDEELISLFNQHLQTQQLFDDPNYQPINPTLTIFKRPVVSVSENKETISNEMVFSYNYNNGTSNFINVGLNSFSPFNINPEIFYGSLLLSDNTLNYELTKQILANEILKINASSSIQSIVIANLANSLSFNHNIIDKTLEITDIKISSSRAATICNNFNIPINKISSTPFSLSKLFHEINKKASTILAVDWIPSKIAPILSPCFNYYGFQIEEIKNATSNNEVGSVEIITIPPKGGFNNIDEAPHNSINFRKEGEKIIFNINDLNLQKAATKLKVTEINDQAIFNQLFGAGKFFKEDWKNDKIKDTITKNKELFFDGIYPETLKNLTINFINPTNNQTNKLILDIAFSTYEKYNVLTPITQQLTINFNVAPTPQMISQEIENIVNNKNEINEKNILSFVAEAFNSISDKIPDVYLPFDIFENKIIQFKESMFVINKTNDNWTIAIKPEFSNYLKDVSLNFQIKSSNLSKTDLTFILTITGSGLVLLILLISLIIVAKKYKKTKK